MTATALVLLAVTAAVIFPLGRLLWSRMPSVLPLLAFAFTLRLSAAVFHRFVIPLPDSQLDAVSFERIGWEWAQDGFTALPENFTLSAYAYSWLISIVYGFIGREPLGPQIINVFLGTLAVLFVYLAARDLWDSRGARRAGWLAALWPASVLYSAILLREALFLAIFLFATWQAIRWLKRGRSFALLSASLSFAGAAVLHGSGVLGLLLIGAAVFFRALYSAIRRSPRATRRAVELGIFAAAFGAALWVFRDPLAFAGGSNMLTLESISSRQANTEWAGSGYLSGMRTDSWYDLLWQTPLRILYFLYSPMPWDVTRAAYAVGTLEGLLYLALTAIAARSLPVARRNPGAVFVLALVALLIVALAVNTFNSGTAIRHRAKVAPLLMVFLPALLLLPKRLPHPRRFLVVTDRRGERCPDYSTLGAMAKAEGWEPHFAGPSGEASIAVRAAGGQYHVISRNSRGNQHQMLMSLIRINMRIRPHLIHASTSGVLATAGLAARITRCPILVGTATDLGGISPDFSGKAKGAKLMRRMLLGMVFDHPNSYCIFTNRGDRALFQSWGIVDEAHARVIEDFGATNEGGTGPNDESPDSRGARRLVDLYEELVLSTTRANLDSPSKTSSCQNGARGAS